MSSFGLEDLERIIAERAMASPDASWTARLVQKGMDKAAQKLGEEAVEAVIAAVSKDRDGLVAESADLLYHLLVVLKLSNIPLADVLGELESRTSTSGLSEKAARLKD